VGDPIYSSRADDPALTEQIDEFVVSLAERVDQLQDAEFKGDVKALESLAGELGNCAEDLGFGSLAGSALAVAGCCSSDDPEEIREVLMDLTEIYKRIRAGHRGSI
jgi:hypothetical protein